MLRYTIANGKKHEKSCPVAAILTRTGPRVLKNVQRGTNGNALEPACGWLRLPVHKGLSAGLSHPNRNTVPVATVAQVVTTQAANERHVSSLVRVKGRFR